MVDDRTSSRRLDGGGEVGSEAVLEGAHVGDCVSLATWGSREFSAGSTGTGALAGAGLTAYAAWEARQYTLRRVEVPLLPAGARPLRVLHLSDIHMTPGQRRKQEWLSDLAVLKPDLVVNTGDNLSHRDAVPGRDPLARGAARRPRRVRVRVERLLRADHAQPVPLPAARQREAAHRTRRTCPSTDLRATFTASGWVDLTNRRDTVKVARPGPRVRRRGRPTPGLRPARRGRRPRRRRPPTSRLGVAHAPYLRVLDAFAADGYDAVLAGHTHGGQVCVPGVGALTTNCDLEPARAKGLHRHPADSRPGRPGLVVAARLRRGRHVAVRPHPGGLPPGGHAAHPGVPGTLTDWGALRPVG